MKRINITCPVCGSRAYLRPASVVYGDKAPDPDAKYYVCGRYKRYDADVFTGVNCRTAAVFQFHSAALRRLNKVGCQRYEGDYTRLKQKHAERRARRMAG